MKEQLIQYVNLLFAGTTGCDDIRQEILQNTLDRYDDLIAEGKTPEAAYRLAIMGIGDIGELLCKPQTITPAPGAARNKDDDSTPKKILRAVGIALYILCPIPLIVLSSELGMEIIGLCGTLGIVAVATVLVILGAKKDSQEDVRERSPKQELRSSINSMMWAIGFAIYFILSFATGAWYITWVVFLIIGAVQGLVNAIMDYKDAKDNEA